MEMVMAAIEYQPDGYIYETLFTPSCFAKDLQQIYIKKQEKLYDEVLRLISN